MHLQNKRPATVSGTRSTKSREKIVKVWRSLIVYRIQVTVCTFDDFTGNIYFYTQIKPFYRFALKSLHRSLDFWLQMTNGELWAESCKVSARNMLVVTCQVKIKGDSCGTPQDLVYSWLIHFIQSQLQPFHEFYLILCAKFIR